MKQQKTFWHLLENTGLPSEYHLLSSKLLYYPKYGFAVDVPAGDWYQLYQNNAALHCQNWEKFNDPKEMTYFSYTELQNNQAIYLNGLFEVIENSHYDQQLTLEWINILELIMPVLRFPCHGLMQIAAYHGQMSPDSKLVIVNLFQAADELKRIQYIAYRMFQLQQKHHGFGEQSQQVWENHPCWQALRESIERLMVIYDWTESSIILNLCLKPLFDNFFMNCLGNIAKENNDYLLAEILGALYSDCQRQQAANAALTKLFMEEKTNVDLIQNWLKIWYKPILNALLPIIKIIVPQNNVTKQLIEKYQVYLVDSYKEFLTQHGLAMLISI